MKHANNIFSFTFLGSGLLYSLTKKCIAVKLVSYLIKFPFHTHFKTWNCILKCLQNGNKLPEFWTVFYCLLPSLPEDLPKRHTNEWHEMSSLHLFEICLNPMHKQHLTYQSIVQLTQCSINANNRVSQSLLSVKPNTSLRHCGSLSGRFLYIFFTLPVLLEHDLALYEQFWIEFPCNIKGESSSIPWFT